MYTQRPFTSQLISKIYFLTFASYIEKLPETTINVCKSDTCWRRLKVPFAVTRHMNKRIQQNT